jgi:hypothetical protein
MTEKAIPPYSGKPYSWAYPQSSLAVKVDQEDRSSEALQSYSAMEHLMRRLHAVLSAGVLIGKVHYGNRN